MSIWCTEMCFEDEIKVSRYRSTDPATLDEIDWPKRPAKFNLGALITEDHRLIDPIDS